MRDRYVFWLGRMAMAVLLVLGASTMPGCGEKKPEEPVEEKPAAPPPPTKEQLYSEMYKAYSPIETEMIKGAPMAVVNAASAAFKQAYSKVNGQRASNAANADPAISQMKGVIETGIKNAKERERWRFIRGGIDCFMAMEPSSTKYKKLSDLTDLMMSMPGVKLKGFQQVDTDTYAFFELHDEAKGTRDSEKVREGEDFYHGQFQFIRIVGNQEKAEIVYKPADYVFQVVGPRLRSQSNGGQSDSDSN